MKDLSLDQSCVALEVERPASVAADAVADALPPVAVAIQMAVLELNTGPIARRSR